MMHAAYARTVPLGPHLFLSQSRTDQEDFVCAMSTVSTREGAHRMQARKALNALLVRWHQWSADPSASQDHMMREFDLIVAGLRPGRIPALIVEARNLACGVAVWRSLRAGGRQNLLRARGELLRALAKDQARWFGAEMVKYNERGNRVGDSNPQASASDRDVELCVQLRDLIDDKTGQPVYSLGQLALRFKVPKATVQSWCDGSRRGQALAKIKGA